LITQQYFTGSLTSGPHNLTLTANPAQSGRYNASTLIGIDRIVVFNASNGTTTKNDHGSVTQPSLVDLPHKMAEAHLALATSSLTGNNLAKNMTQGYTQRHSSKRLNAAVIGGGIAGIIILLLLITLAILLFRRRGPQERSLYRKISIRQPKTPILPMQPPPKPSISLPNPFLDPGDLEKIAPFSIPLEPNENPFTNDARTKLPWVPEACVTRDAYDGRSGKLQVQSKAVRRVSLKS
jgi:hypothetical protein